MTRREYTEKLAESLANIMAATLMDSANQGNLLEAAAKTFAEDMMSDWLWNEIDSDARFCAELSIRILHGLNV